MTLNVHRRRDRKRARSTRVWLDGVEVSKRCFYADGRRGVVRLYKLNSAGQKYAENAELATEERRGHVRWGKVSA